MMLNEITKAAGGHKKRKRVGRGESSGHGKTSGKGHKGCQSRSGGGVRALTEGGQMPIFRRLPKRGFNNYNFRKTFEIVNLSDLESLFNDGDTVDPQVLKTSKLVRGDSPIKVLAKGAISKKLTVSAHAFSEKARQAIESSGGGVTMLELRDPVALARGKRNSAKNRKADAPVSRLEKKKNNKSAAN